MTDQTAAGASVSAPGRARRRWSDAADVYVVLGACLLAILFAFFRRNEGDITPGEGLGYAIGITGASLMLALMFYPLRKRLAGLRHIGSVRTWFRLHMVLGIAGPALIILHSNFHIGAMNSLAAMATMLVVAGSGFIGRFFYAQIHRGLYGQKLTLQEAEGDVEALRALMPEAVSARIGTALKDYQSHRLSRSRAFLGSWAMAVTGPLSHWRQKRRLTALARKDGGLSAADTRKLHDSLSRYFKVLSRAEAFVVYDRLFAAWHMLHLPLFAIMVVAAVAHVIAVHMY